MTHLNYIVTVPAEANGDAVPVEGWGAGDVEAMQQQPGRGWKNANGWAPDMRQSGDEWTVVYYDAAEDLIKERPALDEPVLPTVAPGVVPLVGLPDGCAVRVENEAGDGLDLVTPVADLTLEDSGRYTLQVTPPFPYLPLTMEITLA